MSRAYDSYNNLVWKGLLEVILSKHPLKAVPTWKLGSTLKLDQVSWGPIQSSLEYFQQWTLQNIPGALLWCLAIFMAGKFKKKHCYYSLSLFPMLELVSLLALIISPQTCQKSLTTPALPPPIRQLKRAVRFHFHPSHPKAKQTHLLPPRLAHLVLQNPLISSIPVYCVPRHQSTMLHSFPHKKIRLFCYLP